MGGKRNFKCKWGEFLMAEYLTNDTDLKKVADAIRSKGGTTEKLTYPDGFADAIAAISSGGIPGTKVVMSFDVPSNWTGTAEIRAKGYDFTHTMILLAPASNPKYALAMAFLVNLLQNGGTVSSSEGGSISADLDDMAASFGDTAGTLKFSDGAVETWATYYSKGYVIGLT